MIENDYTKENINDISLLILFYKIIFGVNEPFLCRFRQK